MKKLVIVHYMPLELYPPVTNFINFLESGFESEFKLNVFSTSNNHSRTNFTSLLANVKRYDLPKINDNAIIRLWKYLSFNLGVLFELIRIKPDAILYYESYSSFPVFLYSKFVNSKTRILIHNHEYSPPSWYASGMKTVKFYHLWEKKFLFLKASWIGQTNEMRTKLFQEDHPHINPENLRTTPNFPSKSCSRHQNTKFGVPIRLVYLGSLSIKDFYLTELCDFVNHHKGKFNLQIYSYNIDAMAQEYLEELNSKYINFNKNGINYDDFPETLVKYDIGLILYKANTINQRFVAPNKLFEYLACDLDVWYPSEIDGIDLYERTDFYPKVVKIDFKCLLDISLDGILTRSEHRYKPTNYYYEFVYDAMVSNFLGTRV